MIEVKDYHAPAGRLSQWWEAAVLLRWGATRCLLDIVCTIYSFTKEIGVWAQ
jgi:hypothetical protein